MTLANDGDGDGAGAQPGAGHVCVLDATAEWNEPAAGLMGALAGVRFPATEGPTTLVLPLAVAGPG